MSIGARLARSLALGDGEGRKGLIEWTLDDEG
jgi:hypothetical protein